VNRYLFPALLLIGVSAGPAHAGDLYLVRIDMVGYVDRPATEEPVERTLRSLEVLTQPNTQFHGKTQTASQTLQVSGSFRRDDEGKFDVQIRCQESIDTGDTILVAENVREPLLAVTSVDRTITVTPGERVKLGGCDTLTSMMGKPDLKTSIRFEMVLTKYEPAK